jgi:hypothetical protein
MAPDFYETLCRSGDEQVRRDVVPSRRCIHELMPLTSFRLKRIHDHCTALCSDIWFDPINLYAHNGTCNLSYFFR